MQDKFVQTFLQEAREHLDVLESTLLELEKSPGDMELVGRAFRAMHTIKGSSSMFGFEEIASLTHELESIYDLVRNGELEISKGIIDLSLEAYDQLSLNVLQLSNGERADSAKSYEIVQALRGLVRTAGGIGPPPIPPDNSSADSGTACKTDKEVKIYHIRFYPPNNIFMRGMDPLQVIDDLKQMGDCNISICPDKIPNLQEIDPECCYASWDMLVTSTRGPEALWDTFTFLLDDSSITIDKVYESSSHDTHDYDKLGEILVRRGYVEQEHIDAIVGNKKRLGECLLEAGLVKENQINFALLEQQEIRRTMQAQEGEKAASSIRVLTEKLDSLVDLVGEMVTLQASFRQTTFKWDDISLISDEKDTTAVAVGELAHITGLSGKMEHLVEELRENAMSLRMVPIGVTFEKFRRLVRDLSSELGKSVELLTSGGETELDKTVIEQLNDPMVHVIRNCIDHGIEPPEVREASGKPRQGRISISAEHEGANVRIQIRDDGAGINRNTIREAALERNLISPDDELTDDDIYRLVFEAGFSTSSEVTNVSGRGVGMDVLKSNIESLRGGVKLESTPDEGTCVSITLPLTLAIIDCLLVDIGQNKYLLPLLSVEECVELSRQETFDAQGKKLLTVRGEAVPYIDLRESFAVGGAPPELRQVVITGNNGSRVGFAVDNVIGEHQTVIKPLGSFYKAVDCVSGATVLGDGSVALIVDMKSIVAASVQGERNM